MVEEEAAVSAPAVRTRRRWPWRWAQRVALAAMLVLALLVTGVAVLDSSIGHRFVVDRIATLAPGSGLRIRIGRIDGSLFGASTLHDLVLSDPQGRFMTVPEAELDWRPLSWLKSGLDIRTLVLHRGTLLRAPRFNPGDPDAPILPDFDIRIDRFVVDSLTVAPGLIGERRRIDLTARADIRAGRAVLALKGRLGGRDRMAFDLDSEPGRDRFDLGLVYDAPRDGVLAAITGIRHDVHARVAGRGSFTRWSGWGLARQDGKPLAGFLLDKEDNRYRLAGQVLPEPFLPQALRAAVGERLSLLYDGTFAGRVVDGRLRSAGAAFRAEARGGLDLANSRANDLAFAAVLTRPDQVLADPRLSGVRLTGKADGRFGDLAIDHVLQVATLQSGEIRAEGLRTAGLARWDGRRLMLPLDLSARRVVTGQPEFDRRMVGGRVRGDFVLDGQRLASDNIAVDLRGLAARLALRGDFARNAYELAGPVNLRGFALPDLGQIDGDARIRLGLGGGRPWQLQADASGRMTRIDNATLANLTGGNLRFAGGVTLGQGAPVVVRGGRISSNKLALALDGRLLGDGTATLVGRGRHADYGPFTVDARMAGDGPRAVLVFASPLPAAGLKDVRIALAPRGDGFAIDAGGESRLGPFTAALLLVAPPGGPTRIAIEQAKVFETAITGALTLEKDGVAGSLALAGGGLNGTVDLAPREGGQGVKALLLARNARFGGASPISIGVADVDIDGLFAVGNSTVNASVQAEGIGVGKLFIGRLVADAALVNGAGSVTASLAGRRGTQFALQGTAAFEPDRIVAFVAGEYAGRAISMPRRLVMDREGEGWRLQPTQVNFGRGAVIAAGHVLGGPTELDLKVSRMPLSALDIFVPDLGLGGLVSGLIDYRDDGSGAPTGHAAVQVLGLSRSGLVLTSRPLDLSLVAALDADRLQARAVAREGAAVRGRVQALLSGLPRGGALAERLRGGRLQAQVRYSGPADALWRLAAVEVFDLTGPLGAAADISGTLDHPVIAGAVATRGLRIQSSLTGSDLRSVAALGTFRDSQLALSSFSGTTPNGGRVSGSGTIDLSNLASSGAALDLRLAATNAQLINRPEMGATVTGPLRIVSAGNGGTIAGRVRIDQARWTLGRASAAAALPVIAVREVNSHADAAPPRAPAAPWRFLIDAAGANRIDVRGLGLDSEWSADVRLRGDTSAPRVLGTAEVVRGGYEFAGKRFELTRGRIRFTGEVPIDPQLDILAEGDANGISARIGITGTAQKPVIAFSSTPALPEEELLSRLLFGSSITQISAPEAVQLASALASLRGGGGLDPINKLRSAIGLDRLRIVGADATNGRGTAIAVGKYLGRRFFVELVTDGRGYSATSVEFRITRWLALLATISTLEGQSINLRASKDY